MSEFIEKCDCDICNRSQHIDLVLKKGTKAELRKLVNELSDALANTEEDLDYRLAVLSGSWPSAVEQLTKSLYKALTHPNRKLDSKNVY